MVKKSRSVYLDILRILSVLLVIFTHTGGIGAKMYTVEHVYVNKVSKILALGLDVFRCVNVPLFFMISGALLLRRTLSYKDLLFKRLLKYIMIVVAISYFYSVFYLNNGWIDFGLFFRSIYNSPIVFHLWFLYSCIFRLNGTASPRQRKGCPLQTGSLLLVNSGYACSFHSVQGGTPYE